MPTRRPAKARGEVYLVGAGPGAPELLTLRALKLMQRAEIALYDNLISAAVLDLLPATVERIYVGHARRTPRPRAGPTAGPGREDLRRQAARRPRHAPGGDQRPAGSLCESGQARAAIE